MSARRPFTFLISAVGVLTMMSWVADAERANAAATLQVVAMDPSPGSIATLPLAAILLTFSDPLSATSISAESLRLERSGEDGTFDDGTDVSIFPAAVTLVSPTQMSLNLSGIRLTPDIYRVRLLGTRRAFLRFDGADDLVLLPPGLFSLQQALTLEARVRPLGPGVIAGMQSSDYPSRPNSYGPVMYVGTDRRIRGQFPGFIQPITIQTPLGDGQWLNVALTADDASGIQSLYVDGNHVGDLSQEPVFHVYNQLGTGYASTSWPGVGRSDWFPFNGDIDEVRFWNVVRSEAEIRDTLNKSLTGSEPGLVALWTFNSLNGQVVPDEAQHGHDGILGSSASEISSDPVWHSGLQPGTAISGTDGSALDGEFDGTLPSGDGEPGGDFSATFTLSGIEVVSPNGGDQWEWGTVHTLVWKALGPQNVKIEASANGGSSWILVSPVTANDGQYQWEAPAIASDNFLIRISDAANAAMFDVSDAVFSVVKSTLVLQSPNGGERWGIGTNHPIYWTGSENLGPVRVEVTFDDQSAWNTIATVAQNETSYNWTIPEMPSSECRVRITAVFSPEITDTSDGTFTILYKSTNQRSDVNRSGLVDYADLLILAENWHTGVETPYSRD